MIENTKHMFLPIFVLDSKIKEEDICELSSDFWDER